jgi:glycosyltransferase involved in cell wall biosynthesis
MKILYIINGLGRGGAESLLSDMIPYVKREGIEVEVLQLSVASVVPEYVDRIASAGIKVHDLGSGSVYRFNKIGELRSFFEGHNYDIIHVHLFPAMYWVPLALRRIKNRPRLIFTEHSTQNRRWNKWYFKFSEKYIYKKYPKVIAITDEVKNKLAAWVPAISNNIVVINNGLNLDKVRQATEKNRADLLKELDIKEDNAVLILMTARFEPPKNHNLVVEALQKLPSNYHAVFAGTGSLMETTETFVKNSGLEGRTHFLGFRNDVLSIMKSVDINVLSTHYEGLSGVTLEALAAGKPFLGSDVTGVQNVVPDGRFLFEDGNADDLAEKLSGIIEDQSLSSAMIDTSLNFIEKYDISKMVSEHIALYKSLTGN